MAGCDSAGSMLPSTHRVMGSTPSTAETWPWCLTLLPVAEINTVTQSNLGRKGHVCLVHHRLLSITEGSQGRNLETRPEAETMEEREMLTILLSLLSPQARVTAEAGVVPPRVS